MNTTDCAYVYFFRSHLGPYKIGRTTNIEKRLRELAYPGFYASHKFTIKHSIWTASPVWLEDCLQKAFWHRWQKRELFDLTADDLPQVRSITKCDEPSELPMWVRRSVQVNILRLRASMQGKARSRRNMIAARVALELSTQDLAEQVGLSRGTILLIECGIHHSTPGRWARIASVLRQPAEKLSVIFS